MNLTRDFPAMSPDVDSASRMAQRYSVFLHSIQNVMAKLAEETGSESFFLGLQNLVSFTPYLDRLQLILDNQYFLVFQARLRKKDGLQRVKISTEVPRAEIVSPDNVWLPATAAGAGQKGLAP